MELSEKLTVWILKNWPKNPLVDWYPSFDGSFMMRLQFFSVYRCFRSNLVVLPLPVGPLNKMFSNDFLRVSLRFLEIRKPLLNRDAMSVSLPKRALKPFFFVKASKIELNKSPRRASIYERRLFMI